MSALRAKLAQIERSSALIAPAYDPASDQCTRLLHESVVSSYRVLHLVEPQDTDPRTYADIQVSLAWAKGEYANASIWQAEESRLSPPVVVDISGVSSGATGAEREDLRWVRVMNQLCADIPKQVAKTDAAIDAACKRLGRPRPNPGRE